MQSCRMLECRFCYQHTNIWKNLCQKGILMLLCQKPPLFLSNLTDGTTIWCIDHNPKNCRSKKTKLYNLCAHTSYEISITKNLKVSPATSAEQVSLFCTFILLSFVALLAAFFRSSKQFSQWAKSLAWAKAHCSEETCWTLPWPQPSYT